MREPVDVLLDGGSVRAPQGGGARSRSRPPATGGSGLKLEQDRRLIDELIKTGDRLPGRRPQGPGIQDQRDPALVVLERAASSGPPNDAAREVTQVTEASISRLVRIEIALGLLGVLAALALGLLLRRWRWSRLPSSARW